MLDLWEYATPQTSSLPGGVFANPGSMLVVRMLDLVFHGEFLRFASYHLALVYLIYSGGQPPTAGLLG